MSKAEDLAEKLFPKKEYASFGPLPCEEANVIDDNKPYRIGFIAGYHQAEKDLTDISWIKEVSGVKDMSRAKEEALKAYPPQSIAANYDTISRRDAFEFGYLKAEKDLELSWEDIKLIDSLIDDVALEETDTMEDLYQEVLKRFKAQKGK